MTDAKLMTLTATMVKHLNALAGLAGKVSNASDAIRKDLDGLSEAQVDAFNAAARDHYKATIQNEDRRKAALALLAKVVAVHRKSMGWKGKRKAGAGRKSKTEKTAEQAATDALSQYQAAANYLMVHWMDITDAERRKALDPLMQRMIAWAKANYQSKA